jgi:hydroxypyruvate isomerase
MPRFAANLGFLFADRPQFDRLAAAAACGFRAVETHWPYDIDPAAWKAECARLGLTMLGVNTVRGNVEAGDFGLGAVPGREAAFAAAVDQAVAWQAAVGGTAIHCMAGKVAPDLCADAHRTFVANLKAAAPKAAAKGLMLLLEPINQRDAPTYALSTTDHAAAIIAEVGAPNVKIMFDCYHTQIMQGDLIRRMEKHWADIGHIQIAAVPSRAEPDHGEVNFPAIYEAIDGLGYQGFIGAEYKPRGRTGDGLAWGRAYGLHAPVA